MVFQSISTLITYRDAKAVFRFLQVLGGRCKMAGSTSLFSMEGGMHEESEVQTMKHLMDGVIEFSESSSKNYLRIQGCGDVITRDWMEYKYGKNDIEIMGSFRMERVA
jgi:KaiC/GvpD/RAD55 family RecA-like ATPase